MTKYSLPYPLPLKNPHSPFRNFNYIRPIHIKGSTQDLRDYQVKIVLNSNNFPLEKCKPDGSDIRFRDETGQSLPYWIESWSANEAIIWCKVPFIPANRIKDIWIIYGNPSSSDASNGEATFDLFDDFRTPIMWNPRMDIDQFEKDPVVWFDESQGLSYIFYTYREGTDYFVSRRTTTDFLNYGSRQDIFSGYCAPSNIVKLNGTYYMFFQSYPDSQDPKGYCRIFYSTSTDLETWASPALAFERANGWNGGTQRSIDAYLFYEDPYWYMYYVGKDGNNNAIGLARTLASNFPVGWEDLTTDAPLLTPEHSWEGVVVEAPCLWKVGDEYYLTYTGGGGTPPQRLGLAIADTITGPYTRYGTDGRVNFPLESWYSDVGSCDILRNGAEAWRSKWDTNDQRYHIIYQGHKSGLDWGLALAVTDDLINYELLQSWEKTYSTGVRVENSCLILDNSSPVNGNLKGVSSLSTFDPAESVLEWRAQGYGGDDDFLAVGWYKDDDNSYKTGFGPSNDRDWDIELGNWNGGSWTGVQCCDSEYSQNTWYRFTLKRLGSKLEYYVSDIKKLEFATSLVLSDTKVGFNIWKEGVWKIDYVFVRKYADPEPIVIV